MRSILLFCLMLISLISYLEALEEKWFSVLDYHEKYGIPLAAAVKKTEELSQKNDANSNRIVGGSLAPDSEYPYMGGLVIHLNNTFNPSVCGSSLLNSNRLVTAAHCWWDGRTFALKFDVVLGSTMLFFGGTRIATSNVVMHPLYTATTGPYDVAIIILPENVAFSQSIRPVALPSNELLQESFDGWYARAAGFGRKADHETVYLEMKLHHVVLKVISNEECVAVYNNTTVSDLNLCTSGEGGMSVCQGDSGGPLVVTHNGEDVLVGISIFVASRGCALGFPAGYSRVTSYYDFILQNL